MFYSLWVQDSLRTLKLYHWLPLATEYLYLATTEVVSDNRELTLEAYFEVFHSLWVEDILRILKIHHYLYMVTNSCPQQPQLQGHNGEFEVRGIRV